LLQRIAVGAKRRRHFIAELENRGDDITTVGAVNFTATILVMDSVFSSQ
jgi:hypothetical protein